MLICDEGHFCMEQFLLQFKSKITAFNGTPYRTQHYSFMRSHCNHLVCWFVQKMEETLNHLISMGMSSNDDRFLPASNESWNVLAQYRFSEHCSSKNVSYRSIWRFPHFLKFKFCHKNIELRSQLKLS